MNYNAMAQKAGGVSPACDLNDRTGTNTGPMILESPRTTLEAI